MKLEIFDVVIQRYDGEIVSMLGRNGKREMEADAGEGTYVIQEITKP